MAKTQPNLQCVRSSAYVLKLLVIESPRQTGLFLIVLTYKCLPSSVLKLHSVESIRC